MLARPLCVGHCVHLLLQQLLIIRVHGGLDEFVDGVGVGVDQVDAQVVLSQQLILRVARAVDIIDQLSTTFKICFCIMYIKFFLDYPSQL